MMIPALVFAQEATYTGRIISPKIEVSSSPTIVNYTIFANTTTGKPELDTTSAIRFSSDVVVVGDLQGFKDVRVSSSLYFDSFKNTKIFYDSEGKSLKFFIEETEMIRMTK